MKKYAFLRQKSVLFCVKTQFPSPLSASRKKTNSHGIRPDGKEALPKCTESTHKVHFSDKKCTVRKPLFYRPSHLFFFLFFFQVQIKKEKIVNILYLYNIFTIPPALSNNPYFSKKIPSITKQTNSRARSPHEFFFQKQEPNIQIKDFFPPPGRIFFQVQKTQKATERRISHKHISLPRTASQGRLTEADGGKRSLEWPAEIKRPCEPGR